jgi:hypothetical protein
VLPNSWTGRKQGISKLRIKEMGSRYLFIILYCWLEKLLAGNNYRDQQPLPPVRLGCRNDINLTRVALRALARLIEGKRPRKGPAARAGPSW